MITQGNDTKAPDAQKEVKCRLCSEKGIDYVTLAYKLGAHIGGRHRQKLDNYIERFGDGGFYHVVPAAKVKAPVDRSKAQPVALHGACKKNERALLGLLRDALSLIESAL